MRVPFGRQAFDVVFNFFTSFGYFDDPTEHLQVVSNIAGSLRGGGRLVLDYLNVHAAEARQAPAETTTVDGVTYGLTRWSDARHFFKRIEITETSGSQPLVYVEKVAKFTLPDFRKMFARQGLTIEDVYGDYGLHAFDPDASPRLIVVARRLADGSASRFASRQVLPDAA
jgi:SAM-dependent methyltransferase